MKGDKEITGILRGFDDYVNMVIDDATEMYLFYYIKKNRNNTPTGKILIKQKSILLNGSQVCMLVPNGSPEGI